LPADFPYKGITEEWVMQIVAHISLDKKRVATATYQSGLHVEVETAKRFRDKEICFPLKHSGNKELSGYWEAALDWYFNEAVFDSKDCVFPGEKRRVGAARDHKSLFRQAVTALRKDLEQHGISVEIEYP
jgi:hypothetical protein